MKHLLTLLSVLFLVSSCMNFSSEEEPIPNDFEDYDATEIYSESPSEATPTNSKRMAQNNTQIAYKNTIDPKTNMVTGRVPLPQSWNFAGPNNEGLFLEGPNGIKVYQMKYQSFMYTQDPYYQQIYAQSGANLRQNLSSEQILQQDIIPSTAKQGYSLVRNYPIPQLAKKDEQYFAQLYQVGPSQKNFEVLGAEFNAPDGSGSLLILQKMSSFSQGLLMWGYSGYILDAPKAEFEMAKNHLMNALLNVQHNPQYIAQYNQRERQKSNASWTAHNNRMAANQRSFDATQKAYRESTNAVNDAMMSTWRSQNESSDRMQSQFVDGIWEQKNMTDPNSGNTYKVQEGYNQYWSNGNNEYIGSNDAYYNPNTDNSVNNQNWQQLDATDDGGW